MFTQCLLYYITMFTHIKYCILQIRLITDKQTGRPKGYGFCEFQSPEMATMAIEKLDGVDFNGRQIRVSQSNK